jgi:hypothetical protein
LLDWLRDAHAMKHQAGPADWKTIPILRPALINIWKKRSFNKNWLPGA